MSLQRILSIVVFLILELTRLWALNGRKKMPLLWGEGRFFTLSVPADFYQGVGGDLLRQYYRQITVPYVVEVILLIPVFCFGKYTYILPAVVAASIMLIIWNRSVTRKFIAKVKQFSLVEPEASTVPVALSLIRRRFTDYTNITVESAIIIFTLSGLGIFVRYYSFFNWEGKHTLSAFIPIILYVYLQLGGLLWKQNLVQRRLALPGEETDRYFRIFEERRSIQIRFCDYTRIICALVLPYYLADQVLRDILPWAQSRLFHVVIGFSIMGILLVLTPWYVRMMRAVVRQIDLDALIKMQRRVVEKPTSFRGFAYFDSDNPSAAVRTSGGFVLNFANKRVYLYGVYILGLITLITMTYIY